MLSTTCTYCRHYEHVAQVDRRAARLASLTSPTTIALTSLHPPSPRPQSNHSTLSRPPRHYHNFVAPYKRSIGSTSSCGWGGWGHPLTLNVPSCPLAYPPPFLLAHRAVLLICVASHHGGRATVLAGGGGVIPCSGQRRGVNDMHKLGA